MSVHETTRGSKVNTILLAVVTVLVSIAGFFAGNAATKADSAATSCAVLNKTVDRIENNLMPRQEIQVQLDAMKIELTRINIEQTACHERMMKLEVEVAREIRKP